MHFDRDEIPFYEQSGGRNAYIFVFEIIFNGSKGILVAMYYILTIFAKFV